MPALLFGESPGLLTADNSTYSDGTLCCGGVIDFTWTVRHAFHAQLALSDDASRWAARLMLRGSQDSRPQDVRQAHAVCRDNNGMASSLIFAEAVASHGGAVLWPTSVRRVCSHLSYILAGRSWMSPEPDLTQDLAPS